MKGPDENLQPVLVIVSDYERQLYTWTPPAELPADSYLLQLEDAGSADYSARFKYLAPGVGSPGIGTTGNSGRLSNPSWTSLPPSPPTFTNPTTSPSTSSDTLSNPAKAVIATLGSILFIALLVALGYYLAYRRSKHQRMEEDVAATASQTDWPLSSVTTSRQDIAITHTSTKVDSTGARSELPARDMAELSAERRHLG
ncbi:hypothetical protein VTI74DRAFT_1104 [Chaetomium olivicolor]